MDGNFQTPYTLFYPWVGVIIVTIIFLVVVFLTRKRRAKQIVNKWEGYYDGVLHVDRSISRRTGSMVHTTSYHDISKTIVYFADRRSVTLEGHVDMPHPRGTRIIIKKDRNGNFSVIPAGGAA